MKQFYLCCLFGLMSTGLWAQDIHWSQFEYAPLQLHPAQTGLFNGNYRIAANYRSQWFDVPVAYRTVAVSFDAHLLPFQLENDVWGLGVSFFHDQAGDGELSTLNIAVSTAYTKRITKHFFIGVGVQAGFGNRRFNLQKLTFNDQFNGDVYDPNITSHDQGKFAGNTNLSYADVNTGINFRYQSTDRTWVNLGGGLFHLTRPKVSFLGNSDVRLPMRWNVVANASIRLSERIDLMPSILFQRQSTYQEIIYGTDLRYHFNTNPGRELSGSIGVMHRWDDALVARLSFAYQGWRLGLSYDINISGFQAATRGNGGYELSLIHVWSGVPPMEVVKTCPIF